MIAVITKLPYGLHGLFERGWQARITFDQPQERPNFFEGYGLGDFGTCVDYTGLGFRENLAYTGVIAIYDGKPVIPDTNPNSTATPAHPSGRWGKGGA